MTIANRSVVVAVLLSITAFGQGPIINNVDKYVDGPGRRITIAGSNFGTNMANIAVYFGAAKGNVVSVSDQLIEVTVPAGATFEHVSVTNTATGLTAYSRNQFNMSFGGEHPLVAANLVAQVDFPAGLPVSEGLYDLCLCDFDGDGLTDVAASNNKPGTTVISLFRNTSTAGTPSFVKSTHATTAPTIHLQCGDLSGDGKKDLVVTEGNNGNRVFILKNTSVAGTISFTQQAISLPGKQTKRVDITDLDLDGKPDLVVSDQKSDNKNLVLLLNITSGATISFAAPLNLAVPVVAPSTNSSSDGIAIHDLNGDNAPEILINQFLTDKSNIFIFKNGSTPGTLRFADVTTLTLAGTPVNIRVGDLNGDKKPDIAATQLLAFGISTFVNQSTATEIKFGDAVSVEAGSNPWGLDFGDLDGDGKLDVVVASVTQKSLTVLNNTSTGAAITFAPKIVLTTTFINRHVRIGDVDGDGKPDIVFTSIDDDNLSVPASKVSVIRNKSCIVPKIDPPGPLIVCSGFPIPLQASISSGATYQWKKAGVDISAETSSSFTPVDPGQALYSVAITSDGCTKISSDASVEVVTAAALPAPTFPTNNSPVCKGDKLQVSANSPGATDYKWTGPAGFTATGAAMERDLFQIDFAGRYEVSVIQGTCVAQKGFIIAEMITLPDFKVSFTGNDILCAGSSRVLTASPVDPDFTYQWFSGATAIGGATSTTVTINAGGAYSYKAQSIPYPGCAAAPSETVTFVQVALPTVAFTAPAETCKDVVVTFTNQSTLDANAGANFVWDFGDGSPLTDAMSPTHAYATTGDFNVKLVAQYRGGACPAQLIKVLKVSPVPVATITTASNKFEICPGGKLKLEVDKPFTSYLWSTSETSSTIEVSAGGTFNVQLTNAVGCKITINKAVTLLVAPPVEATATPPVVNIGEKTQLSATPGLASYVWRPGRGLTPDSLSATVSASPQEKTTYRVTATAANGCVGEDVVEVDVTYNDITSLLEPGNFISPGTIDDTNDTWEVGKILLFPQCGVKIFDDKGIKVYEAKPYDNGWAGTNEDGKELPSGVYFYFIKCEGETATRSGSITIIR